MKFRLLFFFFCWLSGSLHAQRLAFISDTQEPLWMEALFLKTERNADAADSLLAGLTRSKHEAVFHLGDLVGSGSSDKGWPRIDRFLDRMKAQQIPVYAICGNHEYMMRAASGEKNFSQRFPHLPNTGYIVVQDSVAVVLFNSNFSKIGEEKSAAQQAWYTRTLDSLNRAPGIRCIIVSCHHAPYTNSNIVDPSEEVQKGYVPAYVNTPKAVLFLSGHSHHLEVFAMHGKQFMVIGGGGGLGQPYKKGGKKAFTDLLDKTQKPRYFYLEVDRHGDSLQITARGFTLQEFGVYKDFPVAVIAL